MKSKIACVKKDCVACGTCIKACPFGAIKIKDGKIATVDAEKCIGCGKCAKICPAGLIEIKEQDIKSKIISEKVTTNKKWYDYLWIASSIYLILGFVNILFAWLGMLCFIIPLLISIFGGGKKYCNNYCGRGQLFSILGEKLGISRNITPPRFLYSKWFRYGFLAFFMTMFMLMVYNTYLVFAGAELKEVVTLLWVFKLPWNWANTQDQTGWFVQYAFGFYSVMLTSTILGLFTMVLFKPRSWFVYCPMGTMTQGICNLNKK